MTRKLEICEMARYLEPVFQQMTFSQWKHLRNLMDKKFEAEFEKVKPEGELFQEISFALTCF